MILGLDLGTNSVGWALLKTDDEGKPCGIIDAGARCFDAGVDGNLEFGKDESRNQKRREARQARRQGARRTQRTRKILLTLQSLGLFPEMPDGRPETIDQTLTELDERLKPAGLEHREEITWLYALRARGLDEALSGEGLGRALYHLAQRRGFKSNRKEPMKDDEDLGVVKGDIKSLADACAAAGHRTVGEHFAHLDPEITRIRTRWLGREMLEAEFDALIDAQKTHHPTLDAAGIKSLRSAIFWQRPLKTPVAGKCSIEKEERRCRLSSFQAQRFRMLQNVNNLQVEGPGFDRPLEDDERRLAIEALESRGDHTWGRLRKVLQLPARKTKFNLERGGLAKMIGNRTNAALREAFAERWDDLSSEERDQALEDLLSYEKQDALIRRARNHWKLDPDAADLFASIIPEPGFSRHARSVVERLLPHLEAGISYASARKREFPDAFEADEPHDILPPVHDFEGELKNPTVERTLTELRGIVNAIVKEHGKPARIRVELGRDIKRSRKDRADRTKAIRGREKIREGAKSALLEETGIQSPSRRDVEKAMLADECNWICPFTGRQFGWGDLFGNAPQVDVEHIMPFSRSLDNSFANKTLCFAEENRNRKGNRTPWEAYHDSEAWDGIIERVKRFKGDHARGKLRRFEKDSDGEALFEEFASRQLNDMRYASRLACDYVGLLYGGRVDAEHVLRVQSSAGGATAHVRRGLLLEGILSNEDKPFKNREDHRHHAVDAIAIALTDMGMVKALADAAARQQARGGTRSVTPLAEPWPGFFAEADAVIGRTIVSHRVDRRMRGPLHQETNYSHERNGGDGARRTVRKALAQLNSTQVEQIVDPVIRGHVERALERSGRTPEKTFNEPENLPTMTGCDGRTRTLRAVRVKASVTATPIGAGTSRRYVKPGANHHMAIHEVTKNGKTTWESEIVTRLEAFDRKRHGRPVVSPGDEDRRFLFTLCSGESVELDLGGEEGRTICTVNSVSGKTIELTRHADARSVADIKKSGSAGGRLALGLSRVRSMKLAKVTVSPCGRIRRSHD